MSNTIKTALIAIIALLSVALIAARFWPSKATREPLPAALETPVIGPFVEMPLRYDGYYKNSVNDLQYLIRFFPEGRVVSVNGTKDVEKDLPSYLIRETRGNPALGLHNVPVSVVGDSIVFITRPEKGEIEYRGVVVSSSMVRLVRHSHITGSRQLMDYIFYPDEAPSK